METQYQIIDLSFLESFTAGNRERMEKYIKNFLDNAPQKFSELKESADKEEWAKVKVSAHSLKPQLNYMGIKQLIPVFESIEEYSGTLTNLNTVPDMISQAEVTLNKGMDELSDYIRKN